MRKLLLHKKEIKKLEGMTTAKNLVLVPTKIYFNKRGIVKVELAIGRGKRMYDKREDLRKRDLEREIKRSLKIKRKH